MRVYNDTGEKLVIHQYEYDDDPNPVVVLEIPPGGGSFWEPRGHTPPIWHVLPANGKLVRGTEQAK